MSDPKNQHTIPQCYLKQFVDPKVPSNFGPCVWIFERKSKRGKRKNVRSVLTETDVYTLQGDYSIEKSLAQLESEYAVIFENKIKNKLPLTPYEHTIFCAFVAAMLQRTLKQKEHIENQMDQMIGWAKQLEMVHGAKPKSSIAWEEAKKDAHKISVVEMVPDIAKILSKMNVAFLCTKSKRVSFITSDSPAYLFNSQLQFQRWNCNWLLKRYAGESEVINDTLLLFVQRKATFILERIFAISGTISTTLILWASFFASSQAIDDFGFAPCTISSCFAQPII